MRLFCILLILSWSHAANAAPNADQAVRRSDEIRLPSKDYTVLVRMTSYKANGNKKVGFYEVMSKGKDKSVIRTLAPAFEKGRLLLQRDKNLWAYLPNVSKPLRISMRERLIGEVANADIVRANFADDYQAVIAKTELLEGKEHLVMNLKANAEDVPYGKVILWVDASTYRPAKAEFYATSGRFLKSCTYERYATLGGRTRPTRVVMKEPLTKGQFTVMEYAKMQVMDLPDKYFTDDYMKKLAVK